MKLVNAAFIAIFLAASLHALAYAQTSSLSTLNSALSGANATATGSTSPSNCSISVYMNGDTLVQNISKFQSNGILNSNLSSAFLINHSEVLEVVVSLYAAELATFGVYAADNAVDQCSFKVYEDNADSYGNMQHTLLFSYSFTRAIYSKINQQNFNPMSLGDVAQNFVMTQQMQTIADQTGTDINNMQ